jgi:hypothetical protein
LGGNRSFSSRSRAVVCNIIILYRDYKLSPPLVAAVAATAGSTMRATMILTSRATGNKAASSAAEKLWWCGDFSVPANVYRRTQTNGQQVRRLGCTVPVVVDLALPVPVPCTTRGPAVVALRVIVHARPPTVLPEVASRPPSSVTPSTTSFPLSTSPSPSTPSSSRSSFFLLLNPSAPLLLDV